MKNTDRTNRNTDLSSYVYHVWADGSFRHRRMGGGFLTGIEDRADEKLSSLQAHGVYFEDRNGSSILAEILTSAAALATMPSGIDVRLHSDCDFVVGHINGNNPDHRKSDLRAALKELFAETARFRSIEAIQENDRRSPNLRKAHHISVAAREARISRPPSGSGVTISVKVPAP